MSEFLEDTLEACNSVAEMFWKLWKMSEEPEDRRYEWITIDELLEEDEE